MEDLKKLLNKEQYEGVVTTEGPVLILAGAGSGKTRVLTYRVAYLINEKNVAPWNIMAITFTNKAAGEMRQRINRMGGENADGVWVSTFHSSCVRILRRFADRLGFRNNFSIYDTDDSKTVMKAVLKEKNIDPKKFREKMFLNVISHAKDEMIDPEEYAKENSFDAEGKMISQVYKAYEERLYNNNAMDFDDLIVNTVRLLKKDEEVRQYYQDRLHYIMVDEYQDTNRAQFELVRLLTGARHNLCVVGDDDQSIYKFRGANIYNILNFEEYYPEAKVIRLEQNYRSTKNILDAANAVISNNQERKKKTLWTDKGEGDKIRFRWFDSAYEEASFIASDIKAGEKKLKFDYRDCAVLYRTNAQSRILEEKFLLENIPYKIVGGVNFYQRKEVKDILAYLKAVDNPSDDVSVRRILNVPKRGIGATTENKIVEYAADNQISFLEALHRGSSNGMFGRANNKIKEFTDLIDGLNDSLDTDSLTEFVKRISEDTGYYADLQAEGTDEAQTRLDNIDEFISKARDFENRYTAENSMSSEASVENDSIYEGHASDAASETDDITTRDMLSAFLSEVSLIADIDSLDQDDNYVVLMTLHSAKGLEFPHVYLAGLEEGLFPGFAAVTEEDGGEEMEEERRLMYVGITRAEQSLTITGARARMVRGETQFAAMSRFVQEISPELFDDSSRIEKQQNSSSDEYSSDNIFTGTHQETGSISGSGIHRSAPGSGYGSVAYGGVYGYGGGAQAFRTKKAKKPQKTAAEEYAEKLKAARSSASGGLNTADTLGYKVGDRVRHIKFGEGTVTDIVDGGRDFEVTVDFDIKGVRKMFAAFAKLEKI